MDASQTVQIRVPSDVVDFAIGHPDPKLLSLDILHGAADDLFATSDTTVLQYGAERGNPAFRTALAGFLTDSYGVEVAAESLFVTSGVSQALDLLCATFTRPGDTVFVEEPTYFLALALFAERGVNVRSMPTDDQGLIVDAVEEASREHVPSFVYTVPTFQNPTGVTLSAERRERLVELSREYGFLVVADEVYHLLDFGEAPPPPMAHYVSAGTVLSLGSFSKILAPGLRLGWLQGAPERLEALAASGLLVSGGGLAPFTSAIVSDLLRSGGQRDHLTHLKSVYRTRASALCDALDEGLSGDARFRRARGGYFVWLELPGIDTQDLLSRAQKYNVRFQPGVKFSSRGELGQCLRLCFAYYDADRLKEGVGRLMEALDEAASP